MPLSSFEQLFADLPCLKSSGEFTSTDSVLRMIFSIPHICFSGTSTITKLIPFAQSTSSKIEMMAVSLSSFEESDHLT